MNSAIEHEREINPAAHRSRRCELPSASALLTFLPRVDTIDSFEIAPCADDKSMVEIYGALFGHYPGWFKHLLVLRSVLVAPFGIRGVGYDDLAKPLNTARPYAVGDKIGRWTLYGQCPDELVTGADDKHLDFRVSLLRERLTNGNRIVLSTAVMTHNTFGRGYLATILPFHRYGVAQLMTNAAAAGRI